MVKSSKKIKKVTKKSTKTTKTSNKSNNKDTKSSLKIQKKVLKMDASIDSEDELDNSPKSKTNRDKKVQKKKDEKKTSKKVVEIKDSISSKKNSVSNNTDAIASNVNGNNKNKKNGKNDSKIDSTSNNKSDANIVKLIEKGGAAVDHEVPNAANYYVLPDLNNEFNSKHFCATLNMSDLKNNNNKFYLIQILVDQKTNKYMFWNRWGRVGYQGQNSDVPCQSKEDAIKMFLKKYNEKTGKGYEEIQIDYANEEETKKDKPKAKEVAKKENKNKKKKDFIFDEGVKNLLNLIYDLNLMNQQMKEIGYDANKMPLGKLSQQMIKEGYEILREIENVLKGSKKGDLFELSSRFYTIIPHNFGYQ